MSRRAWITPDDAPQGSKYVTVKMPLGLPYEAAFKGAFLLLCDPGNWEKAGAQEPQDVADGFEFSFFWTNERWDIEAGRKVIGEVFWYAGINAPNGALVCDGSQVSQGDYPALYAVIADTFGDDSGGNFTLPDLRRRMPVGRGIEGAGGEWSLGYEFGEEEHTLIDTEMPEHDHVMDHSHGMDHNHNIPTSQWDQTNASGGTSRTYLRQTTGTVNVSTHTGNTATHSGNTLTAGGDGAHNNMPPSLALTPCIWAGE